MEAKIEVSTVQLLKAVTSLSKMIEHKSMMPILACVRISPTGVSALRLDDGTTHCEMVIDGDGDGEGLIITLANPLLAYLKSRGKATWLKLEQTGGQVRVREGESVRILEGFEDADWPEVPALPDDSTCHIVPTRMDMGGNLHKCLAYVYAGNDRDVLTRRVWIGPGGMVATDSHRMIHAPFSLGEEWKACCVPTHGVKAMVEALKGGSGTDSVISQAVIGEQHFSVSKKHGSRTIEMTIVALSTHTGTVRVIFDNTRDYRVFLPAVTRDTTVCKEGWMQAIKSLPVVSYRSEGVIQNPGVRFQVIDGHLEASVIDVTSGVVSIEKIAMLEGHNIPDDFRINRKYLEEALKIAVGEMITLKFGELSLGSCLVIKDESGTKQILMGMGERR